MFRALFLILLLSSYLQSEPLKATAIGDYVKMQYAGFIGLSAIGFGEQFAKRRYEIELFYGYAPREVATIEVHSVTLKNNYIPHRIKVEEYEFSPYIGLGVMFMPKQRYDTNSRDDVPSNYYHITGIHALLYTGIAIKHEYKNFHNHTRAISAYIEIGTLDSYLFSYANNPNVLSLSEISSLGVGIAYHY
jgi:hypothetical protein